MFLRLRRRLTLVCTVTTSCILILMACGALFIAQQQLIQRGEKEFLHSFREVLYQVPDGNIIDYGWLSRNESNRDLLLFVKNNGVLFRYNGAADPQYRSKALEEAHQAAGDLGSLDSEELLFTFSTSWGESFYCGIARLEGRAAMTLTVLKSMAQEDAELLQLRLLVAVLVAVSVLALWFFAWKFTHFAVKPIEENQQRQMEFVSAASHELRTPLAVLQTGFSAVKKAPAEKRERFLQLMEQETVRMTRLVDDLLTLAGADNGSWSIEAKRVDLSRLLQEGVERNQLRAGKKGLSLAFNELCKALPCCMCDEERIVQVLDILLDNAIAYTPPGGGIAVSLWVDETHLIFSVADNGPGISAEMKEKIFGRFFRADTSRKDREHFGLGLSIAKEIVDLHGGSLAVREPSGGGSELVVALPLT